MPKTILNAYWNVVPTPHVLPNVTEDMFLAKKVVLATVIVITDVLVKVKMEQRQRTNHKRNSQSKNLDF